MKVIIKNLQKKLPVNPGKVKSLALKVLSSESVKKLGEITILFLNDKQVRELNLMYCGRDCPTDVLSFDNSINQKEISADIAVSCDTALRNSRVFKTTPLYEAYLYVIHGLLHLLGYDDNNKKNRLIMLRREQYLCSMFFNLTPST